MEMSFIEKFIRSKRPTYSERFVKTIEIDLPEQVKRINQLVPIRFDSHPQSRKLEPLEEDIMTYYGYLLIFATSYREECEEIV